MGNPDAAAPARDRLPATARIVEVGPRDGLQNEPRPLDTAVKAAFIEALVDAGVTTVEVSSFVRPDRVPQLADAAELFARLERRDGVRYVALVPNPRGLERALAADCRDIAVFTAASESFNQHNINRSIEQSLVDIGVVTEQARAAGLWVRGYISTAFGCPYEGTVEPARVRDVVSALLDRGCDEISIGDTIGVATPADVERLLEVVLADAPVDRLALHMHDTRGTALANVQAGLRAGITIFDASAGGLGGCPYAPGASGNLATEDLVYLLDRQGVTTGVDLEGIRAASAAMVEPLGHALASRVHAAPPWHPSA